MTAHPLEPTSLTVGRLYLRPWEPWDADEVFAACQDPDIQRWTTVPSPYTEADARGYVGRLSPEGWASGTAASFAVLDATTARVRASVALMGIADGSAEIGYWTAPDSRGQGYTAEAVGAICRWGFGALGLSRVLWRAEVGNWGSRAVAQSCGFLVEGTQRAGLAHRGARVDAWTGSLLADDEVRDRRAFGGRWTDLSGRGPGAAAVARHRPRRRGRGAVRPGVGPLAAGAVALHRAGRAGLPGGRAAPLGRGHSAPLAVEVDGRVAGLVVLLPSALDPGLAEVGWWTAPWARGQHLASRAVRVLAPWARSLGLQRLEAGVDVDNVASQRTAEQAGFAREGVRTAGLRPSPRDGQRHDGVLYALVL